MSIGWGGKNPVYRKVPPFAQFWGKKRPPRKEKKSSSMSAFKTQPCIQGRWGGFARRREGVVWGGGPLSDGRLSTEKRERKWCPNGRGEKEKKSPCPTTSFKEEDVYSPRKKGKKALGRWQKNAGPSQTGGVIKLPLLLTNGEKKTREPRREGMPSFCTSNLVGKGGMVSFHPERVKNGKKGTQRQKNAPGRFPKHFLARKKTKRRKKDEGARS